MKKKAETEDSTAQDTALVVGALDALFRELGKCSALTPNMSGKYKAMRAAVVADFAAWRKSAGL